MNVLSLFDGISCGQIAFERLGIKFDNADTHTHTHYFASEIKKFAIETTMRNYPNTIQLGDVTKLHYENDRLYKNCDYNEITEEWILGEEIPDSKIDILIGGSPCQNFSFANIKDRQGFDGEKSRLFYEYLRLKNEINPKYFLLENVKMKKSNEEKINEYLGVKGLHINSNKVSFQDRKRIYWTNIPNVTVPEDKCVDFQAFKDYDKKRCEEAKVNMTPSRIRMWNNGNGNNGTNKACDNVTNAFNIHCLTTKQDRCPNSGLIAYDGFCRYLTRRELELAQTLPIGYCDNLSLRQVENVTGDGWTVDVIAHILSFIPKDDLK